MGGFFGCCGGGGGTASPLTTKGDLYGFSSANARIPVGSNTQVLTADSTQPLGVAWAAAPGALTNITPDTHPATPTAWDDEFEFGSSIDTTGARFAGANPWTAFNVSTGTNAVAEGSLILFPALTAARNNGGYTQPTPVSAPYSFASKLWIQAPNANTSVGMILGTTPSGKLLIFGVSPPFLVVQHLTDFATFSANAYAQNAGYVQQLLNIAIAVTIGPLYLSVGYDGTNLNFSISATGLPRTYAQVYSETPAAFLGAVPSLIGLTADNEGATQQSLFMVDWFRRIT
jgi:hypothetical protein